MNIILEKIMNGNPVDCKNITISAGAAASIMNYSKLDMEILGAEKSGEKYIFGTLAGITVWVDPLLSWNDTSVTYW